MKIAASVCAGTLVSIAACSSDQSAIPRFAGKGVNIRVAPLSLQGIGVACYDFQVSNGADTVWSQGDPATTLLGADQDGAGPLTPTGLDSGTLCSDRYGNADGGGIAYVGPCDASVDSDLDPDNGVQNTVTLWVDGLYDAAKSKDLGEWRDPCPAGCALDFDCIENRDTLVEFNLTIMRDANQGFFDVAVNFDDIFCSAKVDCAYPGANGRPIELVFDPVTGERVQSVVWAFACTDGDPSGTEGESTHIYMDDVVLDCGGTSYAVDPSAGPGNLFRPGDAIPAPIVQAMVFEGRELLRNGAVDADKLYWNVALGLKRAFFTAGAPTCTLRTRATASRGPLTDGLTPLNTKYPFVDVAVTINSGDVIACTQHPLDGNAPNDGVATRYTDELEDHTGFARLAFAFEAAGLPGGLDTHAVGGGAVEIDACIGAPCGVNALCTDLPAPAPDDDSGRTCACPAGQAGDPEVSCTPVSATVSGLYAFAGNAAYRSTDDGATFTQLTTSGVAGFKFASEGRMLGYDEATQAVVVSGDGVTWTTALTIGPEATDGAGRQETRYYKWLSIGDGQVYFTVRRAWCDWSDFMNPCTPNELVMWRSDDGGLTWVDVGVVDHGPPVWNHAGIWYANVWSGGSQTTEWVASTDGVDFTPSPCAIPVDGEDQTWLEVDGVLVHQWGSAIKYSTDGGCSWTTRGDLPSSPSLGTALACDAARCVAAGTVNGAWRFPPGVNEAENSIFVIETGGVTTLGPAVAETGFVSDDNLGRIASSFLLSGDRYFHNCQRCRTGETNTLAIFDLGTRTRTFTSLVNVYLDGGMLSLP